MWRASMANVGQTVKTLKNIGVINDETRWNERTENEMAAKILKKKKKKWHQSAKPMATESNGHVGVMEKDGQN